MDSDRISDSPLLTDTQREVLRLELLGEEPEDQAARDRRYNAVSDLRERLRRITADYANLVPALGADEIRTVFEDLAGYREHKAREEEAIQQSLDDRGQDMVDPETGEVLGRMGGRVKPPDPDPPVQEGEQIREGVINAIAMYYIGVGDREEFAALLEQGIERANRIDDRIPKSVDVSIDVDRLEVAEEASRSELIEAYLEGDLDDDEAFEVLDAEPGLLLESMVRSLTDEADETEN